MCIKFLKSRIERAKEEKLRRYAKFLEENTEFREYLTRLYPNTTIKFIEEKYRGCKNLVLFTEEVNLVILYEKNGSLLLEVLLPIMAGESRFFSRDSLLAQIASRLSDESRYSLVTIKSNNLGNSVFYGVIPISWFSPPRSLLTTLKDFFNEVRGPLSEEVDSFSQQIGDQEAMAAEMEGDCDGEELDND